VAFIIFLFLFLFPINPVLADENPIVEITDFSEDTDPEWVELTNNHSESVDLTNWYFKDLKENQRDIGSTTLPVGGKIKLEYPKGWLNNDKDTIYLYDSEDNLIDELSYPLPTSTPVPPTSTPILTPTSTPTPTNTPTPDPTKVNPDSGITLTEFMPYESMEWLEFYNSNDYPVKLVSWKMEDKDGHTRNIGSNGVLSIGATSYEVFGYSAFFDNTNSETVIIRNQNNSIIAQTSYDAGLRTLDRSWSLINNNWCQSSITKGYENVTSCASISTPTPTPDSTKYIPDELATASAIIEPKTESSFLEPTNTPKPTPTIINGLILGENTTSSSVTTKKNYFPLILIISGALLLISPIIINKINSKK